MRGNPSERENAKLAEHARDAFASQAEEAFRQFVLRPEFPCLGAKAAFNSGSYAVRVYEELGSHASTIELSAALYDFTRSTIDNEPHPSLLLQGEGTALWHRHLADESSAGSRRHASSPLPLGEGRVRVPEREYATFIAIFEQPRETDEIQFETLLWKQLRALHQRDAVHFNWDSNVRSDPADPHFSFSFGEQALYVIGLHANSSREARRFPWPALVFNPHEQFERLRAEGKWQRMQETIRARDLKLQGTFNPMLSDFGEQSEARQYSGRAVEEHWRAPFKAVERRCPFAH